MSAKQGATQEALSQKGKLKVLKALRALGASFFS